MLFPAESELTGNQVFGVGRRAAGMTFYRANALLMLFFASISADKKV
jgi:hypothetical protein